MALEIKKTNGEIWIKGNATETQIIQLKKHLKILLSLKDSVLINVSLLKKGQQSFKKMVVELKTEIEAYQTVYYYGLKTQNQVD